MRVPLPSLPAADAARPALRAPWLPLCVRAIPALLCAVLAACTADPPRWSVAELALLRSLSGAGEAPASPGNEHADDPRAAALGRAVFFDAGFSANGRVACATCHDPARSYTDGRSVALGVGRGRRNTPTLLGVAWLPFLGWDGHTDSVWSQTLEALASPVEHGTTPERVAARIAAEYSGEYRAVFSRDPRDPEQVFSDVGKALDAYLRTLHIEPAPFDRYVSALVAGDPEGGGHLSPGAQRGLAAFLRSGCVSCHHGPWLTDGEFHNLGLPPSIGISDVDPGRARGARRLARSPRRCRSCAKTRYLDLDFADFRGAFKTPTLRNLEQTGPYMHTGQLDSLEAVVEFYRVLPGAPRVGRRDPQLRPLDAGVSTRDLAAFLRSLGSASTADPVGMRLRRTRTPP